MLDFEGDFVQIINGKSAPTDQTRHGINPATKKPLPAVPVATAKNLDDAVAAARAAFVTWSQVPYEERRRATLAWADALEAHAPDFTALLTREQGRPVRFQCLECSCCHSEAGHVVANQSMIDSTRCIRGPRLARLGSRPGEHSAPRSVIEDTDERTVITRYTPLGVVCAIVPWNFPIRLAVGKIAPAVLTGNVVIVKPS